MVRRDSKLFRPTAVSVSTEHRGATESRLCGRTRGVFVSVDTFECGLRLLCRPCAGALVVCSDDFPLSLARALPACGYWRALHQQIRSCRGARECPRVYYRNPCETASPAASSSVRRMAKTLRGVLYVGVATRFQNP